MVITTQAIVITAIKYGDSSLIVKCLTASHGLKSYLLKGILTARKKTWNRALFQPLMQLELVTTHKNQGMLEYVREARATYPYKTLHTHIKKSAIALFLSEVLHYCLRTEEEDEDLFQFLQNAFRWLDTHEETGSFLLLFLLQLTRYLGFYPNNSHAEYPFFDLQEGKYVPATTHHLVMEGEVLAAFTALLGIKFDTLFSIKINRKIRQKLLHTLMLYFQLHVHGFKNPKSLPVLSEVFSEL